MSSSSSGSSFFFLGAAAAGAAAASAAGAAPPPPPPPPEPPILVQSSPRSWPAMASTKSFGQKLATSHWDACACRAVSPRECQASCYRNLAISVPFHATSSSSSSFPPIETTRVQRPHLRHTSRMNGAERSNPMLHEDVGGPGSTISAPRGSLGYDQISFGAKALGSTHLDEGSDVLRGHGEAIIEADECRVGARKGVGVNLEPQDKIVTACSEKLHVSNLKHQMHLAPTPRSFLSLIRC